MDPIEAVVEAALLGAGIAFTRDPRQMKAPLDFRLLGSEVYIECKQFHTPRIAEQAQRVENVIFIQGRKAAQAFAKLLAR